MRNLIPELTRIVDAMVVAQLKAGPTTLEEILQSVKVRCNPEIREYIADLGDGHLRKMILDRVETAAASEPELQLELPPWLEDMWPEGVLFFRGDDGDVRYIATAKATAEHLRAHIEFLEERMSVNRQRLLAAREVLGK